jgi:hypothetical protein
MVVPDIVSSLDGVRNDGGNIDLAAGPNVTITPDDGSNRITIATTAAGDGHSLDAADGSPSNAVYVDAVGEVGIGTTSPAAQLHVDGSFEVGNPGTGYNVDIYGSGTGGRLHWNGVKGAFRAGSDDGMGYWDDANTGEYSMALGFSVKASGDKSVALGGRTSAVGDYAVCIGSSSEANADGSVAIGAQANTGGTLAIAVGNYVEAAGSNSMVLGSGAGLGYPLVNDIENSLMIGVDDTDPAIFVDRHGRVGIGTTDPSFDLHVRNRLIVGPPEYAGPSGVKLVIDAETSSSLEYPLVIRNPAEAILRIQADSKLSLGHHLPLAILHIEESDLGLESAALQFEDVIVEDLDAVMGLYSGDAGNAGSALSFGEISGGDLADKWGIIRETTRGGSGGGSGLRFTYGTGSDHFTNPIVMYLDDTGKVGIGTTSFGAELLRVDGSACASAWNSCSDLRFKENIESVENALDKVLKLRGVRFNWRREEYEDRNFPVGTHYGVIAQEVEVVLPEIVSTAHDGERSIAYAEIIPILIESIKELRSENLALTKRLEALEGSEQ